MSFDRNQLPDPALFFEAEGAPLQGKGKWRTTRCDFHGGSDSMRVNTESGGWVCMSCHISGGDVISYVMQRYGADFITAAKTVGAWIEDGRPAPTKARSFSASDAMSVLSEDLHLCAVVVSDVRRGVTPTDADWQTFLRASARCIAISQEARR
jgi:hypothetical protein